MANDIEEHILKCKTCKTFQPKQTCEPMIYHGIPELPWDHVGIDFSSVATYTIPSMWTIIQTSMEVDRLTSMIAPTVILTVDIYFVKHSIPHKVISDNRPHFNSGEFWIFATCNQFATLYSFEQQI